MLNSTPSSTGHLSACGVSKGVPYWQALVSPCTNTHMQIVIVDTEREELRELVLLCFRYSLGEVTVHCEQKFISASSCTWPKWQQPDGCWQHAGCKYALQCYFFNAKLL